MTHILRNFWLLQVLRITRGSERIWRVFCLCISTDIKSYQHETHWDAHWIQARKRMKTVSKTSCLITNNICKTILSFISARFKQIRFQIEKLCF